MSHGPGWHDLSSFVTFCHPVLGARRERAYFEPKTELGGRKERRYVPSAFEQVHRQSTWVHGSHQEAPAATGIDMLRFRSPGSESSRFLANGEVRDTAPSSARGRTASIAAGERGIVEVPAAAQRPVKLDDDQQLIGFRPRERDFRREEKLLRFQHFEVRGFAGEVSLHRQLDRLLIRDHRLSRTAPGRRHTFHAKRARRKPPEGRPESSARIPASPVPKTPWPDDTGRATRLLETAVPLAFAARDHMFALPAVNAETSGLTFPRSAVSPILGKNSATATPTCALAERRFCSAARISGRRSSSADGSPAGTSGGIDCWSNVVLRATGPGLRAEQHIDLVFLEGDLPFHLGHLGGGGRQRSLGPRGIESGGNAALESLVEDPQGFLECNRRTLGNLQLKIQLQQFKIGQRDVADETEHHPPTSFFGRQKLRPGGFVQTPDAAPEVNLPGGAQGGERRISGVAIVRIRRSPEIRCVPG